MIQEYTDQIIPEFFMPASRNHPGFSWIIEGFAKMQRAFAAW